MSHVFISYVHENENQVRKLCDSLKNQNINVWLDRENILPGMRWKDAIRQAVKDGAFFIACFSVEYEKRNENKTFMNEELLLAVDELRQYSVNRTWFIPVLFSECNVPALSIGGGGTLLDFQWVNLYSDWDLGIMKLLRVLKVDEIERLKELIEEYGYKYHNYLGSGSDTDNKGIVYSPVNQCKKYYLETVYELKNKYGVLYDPILLVGDK